MKLQNIDEMIILPIQYDRIIDGTNRHKFTLPDQHDQILHLLDNSSVNKNMWAAKKQKLIACDIPLYWLCNRDPSNGLFSSPHNWVV